MVVLELVMIVLDFIILKGLNIIIRRMILRATERKLIAKLLNEAGTELILAKDFNLV